jgi:DnaJ homolog subfamily C member 1
MCTWCAYIPLSTCSFLNGLSLKFDDNGEQVLLTADAAPRPVVSKTWFISLVTGLAFKATGEKTKASEKASNEDVAGSDDDTSSATGSDAAGSGTTTPGGSKTVYAATTKAGGKRRKVVKRK